MSYVRSRAKTLKLQDIAFDKIDVHIHVPAGSVPKDGPSAGLTMAIALASLLQKKPLHAALAMTGEISLRGKVLPVGGVKEKILAAIRSGVTTVILPDQNRNDLDDVPPDIRRKLKFRFVKTIADALRAAL